MLAVVSVDSLHVLLVGFQPCQLGLQLFHRLPVIGGNAAVPVERILSSRPWICRYSPMFLSRAAFCLCFFLYGEVAASGNQNRGHTGINGVGLVEIFRQFAGIEVCKVVDLLMVHGINFLFLLLRQLIGGVHLGLIAGRGGAGLVVTVAVEVVGPPGRLLADGIILRHPATS